MSDFIDIDGNALPPNKTLRSSIYTLLNTPSDIKLCNYYQSYDTLIIETIPEYLSRVIIEQRSPGSIVTVLTPKDDYTPASPYNIETISTVTPNYDTKYYTFKDGLADINFVEIEFGEGVTEVFAQDNPDFNQLIDIYYKKGGIDYKVTVLKKPDGIVSGGRVSWLGGLTFQPETTGVFISGSFYSAAASTINLLGADATYPRIDVIAITTDNEFIIIQGIPAATPKKPSLDPLTQRELTHILIPAGATDPDGVESNVIYDENIEWTVSSAGVTINADSTTDPLTGSKCIDATDIGNADSIFLTGATPIAVDEYESLVSNIKLKYKLTKQKAMYVVFMLDDEEVSEAAEFLPIQYKLDWQIVFVSFKDVVFTGTTFNKVRYWFVDADGEDHAGFYLDYIKLEKGINQPLTNDSIELTGDITGEGNVGTPIETTLKNIITPGTFGSATKTVTITIDSKGRVTNITENNIEGGGGSDVESGDGMDFITNDPVTLGLPSTIDSTTENAVTETSHTHKLGNVNLDSVVDGKPVEYGALYNWPAVTDVRKITSSDDWVVPSSANYKALSDSIGGGGDYLTNTVGGKLKEVGFDYWDSPNTGATNEFNFNGRGAGWRYSGGLCSGINNYLHLWTTSVFFGASVESYLRYDTGVFRSNDMAGINRTTGMSIRLCNPTTLNPNGFIGSYTQNNGMIISTIVIDGVEWTMNLNETKYRNGDWITGMDDGVYTPISDLDWAAKTTEAMCYYDDDEEYGGGETPLETLLHPPVTIHPDSASRASIDGNQVLTIEAQVGGQPYQVLTAKDIEAGTAQSYDLIIKCRQEITIESIVVECDDGTLTGCTVTIGATAITFASGTFSVSTTLTEIAATADNVASAGARVKINTSTGYTGTPTVLNVQLNYTVN